MHAQLETNINKKSFSSYQGAFEALDIPKKLPEKTFLYEFDTYLKDSNAYTNIYFSRYFEWQGICRERWFHRDITRDMLQSEGVLITKRAHNDYFRETFPFQTIHCSLNTYLVKQCSFYIIFNFSVEDELVSKGYQQIVFADHSKKIKKFPEFILKKVRQYELSD